MGNDPTTNVKTAEQQKKNQEQALIQATKIMEQLKLFENSVQIRQQRHLFARILIHGHSNLISHLRKFNKQQQKQILHYLKFIDYQTTDMLYQNLILKGMKEEKKKIVYEQYINFKNKNKECNDDLSKYKLIQSEGEELLNNKKVAILIFAGGMSSRFKNQNNQIIPKQFYIQKQGQKCLLQIALDKIINIHKKYSQVPIYLVHNQINNNKKLKQILANYEELNIKKLIQNQNPIINLSGKMCIKNRQTFQILTAPRGCGDLANLAFKGVKIFQQMKKQGVQYVFTMGIQNILSQVADPYLIGTLSTNPTASVAFKCTYPDNQSQNLQRVVFNKSKSCLQANQLQNLLQIANKNCISVIRRSPVWINNVVFRLKDIQQYFEKKKSNFNLPQVFSSKKIQCTYWNPITSNYDKLQHCYIFQRQLTNIVLNQDLKSIGVMVERQKQFMPVITLDGQWNWEDAYNQYLYYQTNQYKKIKNQNYYSKVFYQNSQM